MILTFLSLKVCYFKTSILAHANPSRDQVTLQEWAGEGEVGCPRGECLWNNEMDTGCGVVGAQKCRFNLCFIHQWFCDQLMWLNQPGPLFLYLSYGSNTGMCRNYFRPSIWVHVQHTEGGKPLPLQLASAGSIGSIASAGPRGCFWRRETEKRAVEDSEPYSRQVLSSWWFSQGACPSCPDDRISWQALKSFFHYKANQLWVEGKGEGRQGRLWRTCSPSVAVGWDGIEAQGWGGIECSDC